MRRGREIAPVMLATAALGLAVAGCGGGLGAGRDADKPAAGGAHATKHRPRIPVLHVVASLPLSGPAASQGLAIYRGVKLALREAGGRAGDFSLRLYVRNDAGSLGSPWNAGKVATNALQASTSASTILYIGELASGATALSSPILSEAGIPQISPGSPATDIQGAAPTAPVAAHSQAPSTLLRLGPSNRYQARAILGALTGVSGCTRVALLSGSGSDGSDLAGQLQHLAATYPQLKLLTPPGPTPAPPHGKRAVSPLNQFLASLTRQGANCGIYAGGLSSGAGELISRLHRDLVTPAVIVGSSEVCTTPWPVRSGTGVPASLDQFLECTAPGPPLPATPAGHHFLRAFRAAYRVNPDPAAAYGYEAMQLGLQVIRERGSDGDRRSSVLSALQSDSAIASVVGTFAFGAQHQTTNSTYSLYEFHDGRLERARSSSTSGSTTTSSTATRSTTTRSTTTTPSTTTPSTTTPSTITRSTVGGSRTVGRTTATGPSSTGSGG